MILFNKKQKGKIVERSKLFHFGRGFSRHANVEWFMRPVTWVLAQPVRSSSTNPPLFSLKSKEIFPLAIFDFNSNRIAINGLFHWFQTGHIRTSSGSYFIEPHPSGSERPEDADTDPVRHVIYGLRPGTFHGDDPLTAPATQSVDQSAPSARQGQFSFNSNSINFGVLNL